MKFGEKVREARIKAGLNQEELANKIGVSLRTITNYELQNRYPKKREVYHSLAQALMVDVNYLMTEDEDFLLKAEEKYGARGSRQASELVSEVSGLFSGGEMAEDDMDEMMQAIQNAYWIAKRNNKKYTPKKHKKG